MKEVDLYTLKDNVFDLIGRRWMLIAAGDAQRYNMMTASWGGLGVLWNRNAATVYLRPQRYTLEFLDRAPCFSLSVLPETLRGVLTLCGSRSGREIDKMSLAELTPVASGEGPVLFEQAELSFICRKLYRGRIEPEAFVDSTLDPLHYPERDHHIVFVGEIVRVLQKTFDE